jgi:hypothetical protein
MRRLLFHAMTALSLTLSIAVVVLWVRSTAWAYDNWAIRWTPSLSWSVHSEVGYLTISHPRTSGVRRPRIWFSHRSSPALLPVWWPPATLQFISFNGWSVGLPMWMLLIPLGVLPACWCARWPGHARRRRIARKLCVKCGYDVRASRDKCPECGEPIPRCPTGETAA